jgi:hypothetical protein
MKALLIIYEVKYPVSFKINLFNSFHKFHILTTWKLKLIAVYVIKNIRVKGICNTINRILK